MTALVNDTFRVVSAVQQGDLGRALGLLNGMTEIDRRETLGVIEIARSLALHSTRVASGQGVRT